MTEAVNPSAVLLPTESISGRSIYGKTFVVGPGKYRTYQAAARIHRLNVSTGVMEEIDGQFKAIGESNGTICSEIKAPLLISHGALLDTVLGESGAEAFISVSDDKHNTVFWGIEDAKTVKPEPYEDAAGDEEAEDIALSIFMKAQRRAEGSVAYHEIFPGITMNCRSGSRFQEEFLFASLDAAREITFLLGTDGLELSADKDGRISLINGNGEIGLIIPPPVLYDADGN
jgi:hypothetical protein